MNSEPINPCCPKCGVSLAVDAPQGLCPQCLLAAAATLVDPTPTPGSGPEAPPLAAVATAFPQLEVLELIGAGGMGAVYRARQPKLDRVVALKLLSSHLRQDPAFAERFNREARVLARLQHPGIVSVFDFGEAGGYYYLLMEYVDGVNLRQAMRAGRFSPAEALGIVPKICDALQYAHEQGVLHRDIKPENILLDSKGRVKIADFGIAKLTGEGRAEVTLTASGASMGTPAYMAPEQIEQPGVVDHRADIYSLGVVFYELLTGELPLGRFAPPSKKTPLDERVDEIVMRALAKERELRQQSATEMKTQVEGLGTGGGPAESGKRAAAGASASRPDSGPHGWLAIVGAILTGLSLPLPLVLTTLGLSGAGGLGPAEFLLMLLAAALFGVPGTVLGWLALGEIRHHPDLARRKPLAGFAALAWPVLVVLLLGVLPALMISSSEPPPAGVRILGVLWPIGWIVLAGWLVRATMRWANGGTWAAAAGPAKRGWVVALLVALVVLLLLAVWSPGPSREILGQQVTNAGVQHAGESGVGTSSIGPVQVHFGVPSGQGVLIELITSTRVGVKPVPDSAGYFLASAARDASAVYGWMPDPEALTGVPGSLPWQIVIRGDRGVVMASATNLSVPEDLARSLPLPGGGHSLHADWLAADAEAVLWLFERSGDGRPGLGVRLRTFAHGLGLAELTERGFAGTGTNWAAEFPREIRTPPPVYRHTEIVPQPSVDTRRQSALFRIPGGLKATFEVWASSEPSASDSSPREMEVVAPTNQRRVVRLEWASVPRPTDVAGGGGKSWEVVLRDEATGEELMRIDSLEDGPGDWTPVGLESARVREGDGHPATLMEGESSAGPQGSRRAWTLNLYYGAQPYPSP